VIFRGGYRGGREEIRPPPTDLGRGVAPPPEFGIFVPIFRIASNSMLKGKKH